MVLNVENRGASGYQRPNDWLAIPPISLNEEVVYILVAVHNIVGNFAALKFNGNYRVDWGDGNAENIASGVKAEHSYNWADVSNLTSEGFRQALIKVTPQAGQNITVCNLQQYHTLQGTTNFCSQFIDVVLNIPNVSGTSLTIGGSTIVHRLVNRVWIKEIGVLTSTANLCYYLNNIEDIPLFDTSQVTSAQNMFIYCSKIASLPKFNFTKCTNFQQFANYCYRLKEIQLIQPTILGSLYYAFRESDLRLYPFSATNSLGITSLGSAFAHLTSIRELTIPPTPICTDIAGIGAGSPNLHTLIMQDVSGVTSATNFSNGAKSLAKCILTGIKVSFNISSCSMSASALNELGNSVADMTGLTAKTVTVTGNYGASTMDTSIWTAKNWTVIN